MTWYLVQNCRIESRDILLKLGTGHFKNISSHIEWLLGWLYGLILNNYPVTYSFIGFFLDLRWKKYHLDFDSKLKDWTNGYLIENWERLSQEYIKSYRIAFRVALWLVFKQVSSYLFIHRPLFWSYGIKTLHRIWYEIEGLNQEISYWNLAQVISRVFQVI